jgi:manganese efflux pump family protein
VLHAVVGGKMLWEGIRVEDNDEDGDDVIRFLPVVILSFATSIDALAVGISLGLLQSAILVSAVIIGFTSFILSFTGVAFGRWLLAILGNRAEILGGSS